MALKTKIVEVEGIGQVEIRELLYSEAEGLFNLPSEAIGKEIIKACIYIGGVKAFDTDLGFSDATKLFTLVDQVMEINGMGKQEG